MKMNIFNIKLQHGYIFKEIVDMMRLLFSQCSFIFTDKSIIVSQPNMQNNLLLNLEVKANELIEYNYNCDTPLELSFLLSQLSNSLKSIGKKDILTLTSSIETDKLLIDNGLMKSYVKILTDRQKQEIIVVEGYKDKSYVALPMCQLYKIVYSLTKSKTNDNVYIDISDGKIKFHNINEMGGSEFELDCDKISVERKFIIPKKNIKPLCKLNNCFKDTYVKIYIDNDLPIKFVFNNYWITINVFYNSTAKATA